MLNMNDNKNYIYYGRWKKERHWADVAEEEAIQRRMIQEAIEQQQAQQNAVGQAGAGGSPEYRYFNPNTATSFTSNITTADAPFSIQFTNTSHADITRYGSFSLEFGDGLTSSDPNTSYLYTATGSFSASLVSTTFYGGRTTTSSPIIVSGSIPTVTAAFTYTTASVSPATAPATATFTNTSTNSSQVPTTIYLWDFGQDSSSVEINPTQVYASAGSFTASLQVTGSFGLTSRVEASFRLE